MGRITTHVLDTSIGKPGRDIAVALYRLEGDGRTPIATTRTNSDGRCDQPLLEGDNMQPGVYELDFHVGAYFAKQDTPETTQPFLDRVTLRFGVAKAQEHYHVPLLVTPWSYSTYRGS
jgi:5-hydroxyisourate hydrolase